MTTNDITGRLIYDPNVILRDMAKALNFFSGLLASPFSVETYYSDMTIEVPDYGMVIYIDKEHIHIGEHVLIPGIRTLPNGDPGFPDETDDIDLGSFTFDNKNDAINTIIGALAMSIHKYHTDEAAMNDCAEEPQVVPAGIEDLLDS